ncbi:class I SAM-dependent methyltransferase [Sandaracinobacteroides sp. A072]|uniref:class I SAM-dependent methyltransferase n=1 Tax=Sandaracinobacteroides sp. A072 TaxID=3461146 RepID=UPI004042A750
MPKRSFCLPMLAALLAAAVPAGAQVRVITSTPHAANPLDAPDIPDPILDVAPPSITLLQVPGVSHGDEGYRPEVGQPGKDVIWVPTPDSLVKAMLTVAQVKPTDQVVDLGSGDGRIPIAAARDFGARARGIEYNAEMVALARRNAIRAGVADKVSFLNADIFQTDFSDATVVTMYLLPSLNLKLRETLLRMRPGTRIVSNAFSLGEWEPERTITTDDATGYFWIVPANAAGRWAFELGAERFAAELGQQYQMLTGARGTMVREGRLRGTAIRLTLADGRVLEGQVRGDEMSGPGWEAQRIRPAG